MFIYGLHTQMKRLCTIAVSLAVSHRCEPLFHVCQGIFCGVLGGGKKLATKVPRRSNRWHTSHTIVTVTVTCNAILYDNECIWCGSWLALRGRRILAAATRVKWASVPEDPSKYVCFIFCPSHLPNENMVTSLSLSWPANHSNCSS